MVILIIVKQNKALEVWVLYFIRISLTWLNRMGMARMKAESQNSRIVFWPYLALFGHTNNSKTKLWKAAPTASEARSATEQTRPGTYDWCSSSTTPYAAAISHAPRERNACTAVTGLRDQASQTDAARQP